MNIGTNIHILRKEKKITQAQLAEKLGVSEQSVSKWENNLCAPDVSLLPVIAGYFGVSIDRLFGYHINSYLTEVAAILKAADDSGNTYKEIKILSDGLKKYPGSPDLKIALAFSFSMLNRMSTNENEKKEAVGKAIGLCTEVVDTAADNQTADRALNMLSRIYGEIGEHQKALETIQKISGENYFFRVIGMARTLGYAHNDTEMTKFIEKNLFDCWLAMDSIFEVLTARFGECKKHEEAISFCKAHLKLLSVFDEGCPDFYATHKFFATLMLAHSYRKIGNKPSCLAALDTLPNLLSQIKRVEKSESFHIAARNPLYFSHVDDSEAYEEYITGFSVENLFSSFDTFFQNDGAYLRFKENILQS